MTPRSCLSWKPTGRIFKTIGLRWVPTGKIFAFSTNKVDSEPPNGLKEDITNQCVAEQDLDRQCCTLLSTGTSFNHIKEGLRVWLRKRQIPQKTGLASFFMAMTSDHNRSELGIQDHNNEQTSSKLVPKVVPLAVKTATSRQELELVFHLHIAMLRTTDRFQGNMFYHKVAKFGYEESYAISLLISCRTSEYTNVFNMKLWLTSPKYQ
ncbi:hypothetical protein Tco_1105599 [Tanacetum coccineum]